VTQAGLRHERVRVHHANLREFLAPLDLAGNRLAVDGELGVLTHERGGRGLPAGVGINLRVSPREMDRSIHHGNQTENYLTG
jgi:hypothetical protein